MLKYSLFLIILLIALACNPGKDDRELEAVNLHTAPVTSLGFSPGNTVLLTASLDDTIRLIDVTPFHRVDDPALVVGMSSERSESPLLGRGGGFESVGFSPDGFHIAGGGSSLGGGGIALVWDLGDLGPAVDLAVHATAVRALAFSPDDGATLATGSGHPLARGGVRLWETSGFDQVGELTEEAMLGVRAVAYSPDGSLLATASDDGLVRLWDATSGEVLARLEVEDHMPFAVAFSPDGSRIATAGDDSGPGFHGRAGIVRVWDVEDASLVLSLDLGSYPLRALAYSPPTGDLLAAGGVGMEVDLVDPWSGEMVDTLTGHSGAVNALAFSPNGQLLASGSDDHFVRLWYTGDLVGDTCNDGIDNDGDGWIDVKDPDCEDGDREEGYGETECNDDVDNDDDGYEDAADPDCSDGFDDDESGSGQDAGPDGGDDAGPDGGDDAGSDGGASS